VLRETLAILAIGCAHDPLLAQETRGEVWGMAFETCAQTTVSWSTIRFILGPVLRRAARAFGRDDRRNVECREGMRGR
jgi:hypothetical protein